MDTRIFVDVGYRNGDGFVPLAVNEFGEAEVFVPDGCRKLEIELFFDLPNENLKSVPEIIMDYTWYIYGTNEGREPVLRGKAIGRGMADQERNMRLTFDLPEDTLLLVAIEAEVQSVGFDTYRGARFALDIRVKREYNEEYCEPCIDVEEGE